MNTLEIAAAILLIAALVLAGMLSTAREETKAAKAALASVQESARNYNDLFKEEERDHNRTSDRLAELQTELNAAQIELRALRSKTRARTGPCHIRLADAMSEEQIAQALAGTAESGTVKAIVSHVSTRMVRQLDAATDRPSAGFTADQRLHESGGASTLAELLRDLQGLTAPREIEEKKAA